MKNLRPLLRFQREIRRFLHKRSYDVIHACDFDTAWTALHSVNRKKTRFVYDVFDYYADAFRVPGLLRKVVIAADRRVMQKADAVIICSEERRSQIGNVAVRRLEVIHNTPPRITSAEAATEDGYPVRIAYFGILSPKRLLRELAEVVLNDTRLELHIGGFGVLEKDLKEMAEVCKRIRFYGTVPYETVLEKEAYCDILPAIYDPQVKNHRFAAPNKFYEGLMLGKPLIMAEETGMSGVVDANRLGVVIPYSKEGLVRGLEKLLAIRNEWPEMGRRMRSLYEQEYSWEIMEERLTALYRSLEV